MDCLLASELCLQVARHAIISKEAKMTAKHKGAKCMADYEQNNYSRSQRRQQKNNSMNRLLNYLIALVIVLIGIASYIIFFTGDDQAAEQEPNEQQTDEHANDVNTNDRNEQDTDANDVSQNQSDDFNESSASQETDESNSSNDSQQTGHSSEDSTQENIAMPSTDPLVDEVIVNPNWQPTKTAQTEPHTSVFKEGHIDYEEKLATVFAATSLSADDSIVWNFKNNGSANTAIAVVSSADKTEKYRVSIEWVANEGWKPVKLEKLNTIEGSW